MRRLTRGPKPACLMAYRHGRDNWDTLHAAPADVDEVRAALTVMQGGLCAYCEVETRGDWHIEHLWSRADHPQRTFDWSNLFASCNRRVTCGTYKDHGGKPYNAADLIDPASEDPDRFLFFSADGLVQPRALLGQRDQRRAEETIRVFNLNAPVLVLRRQRLVSMLLESEPDILELMAGIPAEDRPAWIDGFVDDYCSDGFPTTVRHLLSA